MDKEINWADYIGFLIALFSMIVLFFRRKRQQRKAAMQSEEVQGEGQTLEEYLQSLKESVEEREEQQPRPFSMPQIQKAAMAPPPPQIAMALLPPLQIAAPLKTSEVQPVSRAEDLPYNLSSLQELIIAREIVGKPLALRDDVDGNRS